MSLSRVATNPESLFSMVQIRNIDASMKRTMSHLSTGKRIVNASDDPSGLKRLNVFRSQLSGTRKAIENAENALSMLSLADSTMQGVFDKLLRARDLAIRAANEVTITTSQRSLMQREWTEMVEDINDMETSVTFNGITLFDGSLDGKIAMVGPNGSSGDKIIVSLPTITQDNANTFGLTAMGLTGLSAIVISGTGAEAALAISQLTTAIGSFSQMMILVGNQERRLETVINDLSAMELGAAEMTSRLGDADMTAEITAFSKQQILSQAATAMLAQANMQPGAMLELL